jgi:hypothetical protein
MPTSSPRVSILPNGDGAGVGRTTINGHNPPSPHSTRGKGIGQLLKEFRELRGQSDRVEVGEFCEYWSPNGSSTR